MAAAAPAAHARHQNWNQRGLPCSMCSPYFWVILASSLHALALSPCCQGRYMNGNPYSTSATAQLFAAHADNTLSCKLSEGRACRCF